MRDIILYGPMRAQFGRSFKLDIRSTGEALRAMSCIVPGFRKWFNERARKGFEYKILIGKRGITADELAMESDGNEPIRIVPVVTGSKNTRVLGAVLAIAGVALLVFTGNPLLFKIGIGMAIAGVATMLVPTVKTPSPNQTDKLAPSQVFDGPVNTANPGNPKPVLYGTLEVGSIIVSAGIYTEDISPALSGRAKDPVVGPPFNPDTPYSRWNP